MKRYTNRQRRRYTQAAKVKTYTGGKIHVHCTLSSTVQEERYTADTGRIDSQTVVNVDRGGGILQRADTAERYTAGKIHCQAEEERFTIRLVKA